MIRPLAFLAALAILPAVPVAALAQLQSPHPAGGGGSLVIAPNFVEVVVPCGPNAHYVQTHRDNLGHWVKGSCVRNPPAR